MNDKNRLQKKTSPGIFGLAGYTNILTVLLGVYVWGLDLERLFGQMLLVKSQMHGGQNAKLLDREVERDTFNVVYFL